MSIKKAGITIFSLLIILIIILLTVKGFSISKKSEEKPSKNNKPEVVLQEKNNSSEKENNKEDSSKNQKEKDEKPSSSTEKDGSNGGKTPVLEEPVKEQEEEKAQGDDVIEEVYSSFIEVSDPVLGEPKTVSALISSKKSFMVDSDYYAFTLGIVVPNGDEYDIVNYYCSKKTYDAVATGESVKVEYQTDEVGRVCINSISR